MAFVTMATPNTASWDRIHFEKWTVPDGVTVLSGDSYPKTETHGTAAIRYFTLAFSGITGPVNATVELYASDGNYGVIYANVTLTYA